MMSKHSSLRIVVAGHIVGGPLGGLVWHHVQYVLGLYRMGHDVLFLEDSNDYPSCYNPDTLEFSTDPSYGIRFINDLFQQLQLHDRWCYYDAHSGTWFGLDERKAISFCRSADLLLNLSGMNPVREYLQAIPVRAYVDTDPVFTQIRHLTDAAAFVNAAMHNRFFSFGENFGSPSCTIPDDHFAWQPTRQPLVTQLWQVTSGGKSNPWTTVMQWDSYKAREYDGSFFGMKSSSFEPYFNLPATMEDSFELAIGSPTAPREMLKKNGWSVADPISVTKTPQSYQQYIRASKGEWSVAKQGYVISSSGWFSERSCCYLASGRPVVVQDTGFSKFIETGLGLLSFADLTGARNCIESVNEDYEMHCRNARELAEACFGYEKVLTKLMDSCFQECSPAYS